MQCYMKKNYKSKIPNCKNTTIEIRQINSKRLQVQISNNFIGIGLYKWVFGAFCFVSQNTSLS